LALQEKQGLEHRLARDGEPLSKLVLDHALPRRQAPGAYLIENGAISAIDELRLDREALHGYRIPYTIIRGKAKQAEQGLAILSWNLLSRTRTDIRAAIGPYQDGDQAMDEDRFNMSIRKFLKVVGVTSQREIENAVRAAIASGKLKGNEKLKAKVTLTLSDVSLSHDIDGDIELG
jgi:hypothetical protein